MSTRMPTLTSTPRLRPHPRHVIRGTPCRRYQRKIKLTRRCSATRKYAPCLRWQHKSPSIEFRNNICRNQEICTRPAPNMLNGSYVHKSSYAICVHSGTSVQMTSRYVDNDLNRKHVLCWRHFEWLSGFDMFRQTRFWYNLHDGLTSSKLSEIWYEDILAGIFVVGSECYFCFNKLWILLPVLF